MKCENCGNEHDGSYGSGRFCSNHCRHVFIGKQVKHHVCNFKPKCSEHGTWKCRYCGLVFNTRKLMTEHKHKEHPHIKHQAWNNPHIKHQAWNKGLTKETSEAMRRCAETLNRRIASGEIKPSNKGKHHTEEHRRKISESRKKYLKEHPEKVPYVLNHSSKESFPERFSGRHLRTRGFPSSLKTSM